MNAPSNRAMRLVPRKDRAPGVAAKSGRLRTVNREAAHRWVARAAAASPARSASAPTARTREETPGSDRTPGLSAALRAVIEELPPTEITEFIDTVTGTGGGLDPALWGSPPSTTDAARAHLVTLTAKFSDRQTVLAQSITRAEASALLGISDQAVSDRLNAGDLVGLKDGRGTPGSSSRRTRSSGCRPAASAEATCGRTGVPSRLTTR